MRHPDGALTLILIGVIGICAMVSFSVKEPKLIFPTNPRGNGLSEYRKSVVQVLTPKNVFGQALVPGYTGVTSRVRRLAAQTRNRIDLLIGQSQDGHRSRRRPVPLIRSWATVDVLGPTASVTITQQFRNPYEGVVQDTVYRFPMDDAAAVTGFGAMVGTTELKGIVLGRREARKAYKDAVSRGEQAYLGEADRADLFTISLGNVPPDAIVSIHITYITTLQPEGVAGFRFSFPLELQERYGRDEKTGEYLSMRQGGEPLPGNKPFEVTARIKMPSKVRSVEVNTPSSPSTLFRLRPGSDPREASFEYKARAVPERKLAPLVVKIQIDDPTAVFAVTAGTLVKQNNAGGPSDGIQAGIRYHVGSLISFVPDLDAVRAGLTALDLLEAGAGRKEKPKPNIFIVVDRSGSMDTAAKLLRVKKSLRLLVKSFPNGTCFNIVSYGSRFDSMWPLTEIKESSAELINDALAYIKEISANYGGTEILSVVRAISQAASQMRASQNRQTRVILLTDGLVHNTLDVIREVTRSHAADNSIWSTLGIGSDSSHELVAGIARAGHGVTDHIDSGEWETVTKIMRIANVMTEPYTILMHTHWTTSTGEPLDCHSPYDRVTNEPVIVTPGARVIIAGTCDSVQGDRALDSGFIPGPRLPHTVRVTFSRSDSNLRWSGGDGWRVTDLGATRGRALVSIAAKRMVDRVLACSTTINIGNTTMCNDIAQVVTSIGLQYHIGTRFTSFVAVDAKGEVQPGIANYDNERPRTPEHKRAAGPPKAMPARPAGLRGPRGLVDVARSWSKDSSHGQVLSSQATVHHAPARPERADDGDAEEDVDIPEEQKRAEDKIPALDGNSDGWGTNHSNKYNDMVMQLIMLQQYDGHWRASRREVLDILAAGDKDKGASIKDDIEATIAVILFFHRYGSRDIYLLSERKALDWLDKHLKGGKSAREVIQDRERAE